MEYYKLAHLDGRENWFHAEWFLGNTCNYTCSYCPEYCHSGSSSWVDLNVAQKFSSNLIKYNSERNKKTCFLFTGGEPTLWQKFPNLCQSILSQGGTSHVVTNLSRTVRYWKEAKNYLDRVFASYHPEQVQHENFLKVCNEIKDSVVLDVIVLMIPERFDELFNIAVELSDNEGIYTCIKSIYSPSPEKLYTYSPEQKAAIIDFNNKSMKKVRVLDNRIVRGRMSLQNNKGEEIDIWPASRFALESKNKWRGWLCYAGVERIIIDGLGDIFGGYCKVGGKISNIHSDILMLPTHPVTCNKDVCSCAFDIMVTKVRNGNI